MLSSLICKIFSHITLILTCLRVWNPILFLISNFNFSNSKLRPAANILDSKSRGSKITKFEFWENPLGLKLWRSWFVEASCSEITLLRRSPALFGMTDYWPLRQFLNRICSRVLILLRLSPNSFPFGTRDTFAYFHFLTFLLFRFFPFFLLSFWFRFLQFFIAFASKRYLPVFFIKFCRNSFPLSSSF